MSRKDIVKIYKVLLEGTGPLLGGKLERGEQVRSVDWTLMNFNKDTRLMIVAYIDEVYHLNFSVDPETDIKDIRICGVNNLGDKIELVVYASCGPCWDTPFMKVQKFMKTAGQNEVNKDLSDKKLIKFRLDLIKEELSELEDALATSDRAETMDALGDILYVVYGAGVAFDINLDEVFDIVHESNMSKFCKTEQEAKKTVEIYKNSYLKKESVYESPDYELRDGTWVCFNRLSGKILKNVDWKKPDFKNL